MITLNISGIKCDSCDYKDSSILMKDYDTWLNKACPVCGANLLTELDYNTVKKLSSIVKFQSENLFENSIYEPILVTSLEMNGSGDIIVSDMKIM